MKKILVSVLAVLMIAGTLAGCAPASSTAPASNTGGVASGDSGVLRVSIGGIGAVFDPQFNNGADGSNYMTQMFEGLYYYEPNGVIKLGAASDVKISDDQLVYTFTLRDDGFWSDGKPVTAKDFEFSYKRLVDPLLVSPNATTLGAFFKNGAKVAMGELGLDELGVKALDEKTLEITLEEPCPFFDDVLSSSTFFPVREDVAQVGNEGKWSQKVESNIVNGPYKMVAYNSETGMRLERNEHYTRTERQVPEAIEFLFMADENAALGAFTAKETNFTMQIPSEEIPRLTTEGVYHAFPRLGTYFLLINHNREPYNNPLVRQALALAFDPEYIAQSVMNGRFTPAQAFICNGFTGVADGVDFRTEGGALIDRSDPEANIKKAQELLAQAGYPGGEGFPVIEYMYNTTVDNTSIAQALQGFWEENLGITVNLSAVEGQAMGEIRKQGDFDITRQGWLCDYNDALDMMSIFTTESGVNQGKWTNKDFDDLYFKALGTADRAERMNMVHQMESILIEDMGAIPVMHYMFTMLYDPAVVDGVYTSPAGQLHLTRVFVTE